MIFRMKGQEEQKTELIANLHLEHDGNDGINVIATMANDDEWYLLTLNSNGTFTKPNDIENDIGFKVSKNGCLREQK